MGQLGGFVVLLDFNAFWIILICVSDVFHLPSFLHSINSSRTQDHQVCYSMCYYNCATQVFTDSYHSSGFTHADDVCNDFHPVIFLVCLECKDTSPGLLEGKRCLIVESNKR